jgi:hypothetical protein
MRYRRYTLLVLALTAALMGQNSCEPQSSDTVQRQQQETILAEGTSQVGMPAIKNFRERKLMKQIFEMRDQDGLVTYTYLWSEVAAKKVFFCESVGFGLPYSAQYTNPQKALWSGYHDSAVIAQADPNGLFMPSSADATWVMCKDPNGPSVKPVYVEPKIIVSPFRLPTE